MCVCVFFKRNFTIFIRLIRCMFFWRWACEMFCFLEKYKVQKILAYGFKMAFYFIQKLLNQIFSHKLKIYEQTWQIWFAKNVKVERERERKMALEKFKTFFISLSIFWPFINFAGDIWCLCMASSHRSCEALKFFGSCMNDKIKYNIMELWTKREHRKKWPAPEYSEARHLNEVMRSIFFCFFFDHM